MKAFNEAKRKIPPTPLPDWMWDHGLRGSLAGVEECHLANDVLLVYTHKDDVVTLLDCCTHEELDRSGSTVIKKRLRLARVSSRSR